MKPTIVAFTLRTRHPRGIIVAPPMPNPPNAPKSDYDDLLSDLPPLDGDDDDEPLGTPDLAELELLPDESPEDRDDGVIDDLAIGELIDTLTDDTPDDAADSADLDTGETDVSLLEGSSRHDDDTAGVDGDDTSLGIDAVPEQGAGDDDSEGTTGESEGEVDEAQFPELDSDDEADLPGGIVLEEIDVPDDAALPEWAAAGWERVALPLVAVPMNGIWIGDRVVIAAGTEAVALRFSDDGAAHAERLELQGLGGAEAVAIQGDPADPRWLIAASHHAVVASRDGGATVSRTALRVAERDAIVSLSACRLRTSEICARTASGKIHVTLNGGAAWKAMEGLGEVLDVAQDESGNLHVLAWADETSLLRIDPKGHWEAASAGPDLGPRSIGMQVRLAIMGETAAVASAEGRVWLRSSPDSPWQTRLIAPELCATAIVRTSAGPCAVAAVFVESTDRSYLVRIPIDGPPELIADLSPDVALLPNEEGDEAESLGRASCLAWDDRRALLWVAGRFGLQAWRPVVPT